jgi:hypothetical protein
MKRVLLSACAALALSACASGPGYYGGGDAYYDDFYGPYYDGYWGRDGAFWFSDGHGHMRRDEGGHFSREHPGGGGFHGVHAHSGFHRH